MRLISQICSMTNETAVAEKLLQVKAIKLSPQQPFTWASGWKSPIYCDNRKVLGFPYIRDFIKSELCSTVFTNFPDAELIAGVATAGIAWGAMVADQLKLPYIYVRPKPKEHGLGNQVEGYFEKGWKTVVIEDLISTGKSSLQVCEVLKNEGISIEGMVSIFTYGFDQAIHSLKDAGITHYSLTNYETLIGLALRQGVVGQEDENTLLKWRSEPAKWNAI